MKRLLLFVAMLGATVSLSAQQKNDYGFYHYQDAKNPQMARHIMRHEPLRCEIVIPQVNGYNVYKSDLHTHTIYSDGSVTPEYRIREAWLDGLDVIGIFTHFSSSDEEDKEYTQYQFNQIYDFINNAGNFGIPLMRCRAV